MASYTNLCGERFLLRRLLGALAGLVKAPAVIHAANRVGFDPAGGKLRAAMRAAKIHDVRRPALPAVERIALAHDLNRFGLARTEVFRAVNGMPKAAHELSGESAGTGGDEIVVAQRFMGTVTVFAFGSRHLSLRVFCESNHFGRYSNAPYIVV